MRVLVVLRFEVAAEELSGAVEPALAALAACPGFVRAQLGRAYDESGIWCLVTEWVSVGAYRRALGSYQVKLQATPLLARARPEASAFEVLAELAPGEAVRLAASDRAGGTADDGTAGRIASRP